jgi:2-iminobutanoate/2-iminopropanoate deaminase
MSLTNPNPENQSTNNAMSCSSNPAMPPADVDADRNLSYSEAERLERSTLDLPACEPSPTGLIKKMPQGRNPIPRKAITARDVLNEAPDYGSAFPRGLRIDLPGGVTQLLISGTSSVGPDGETLYAGDFRAQLWRTFHNITRLLESEGATWEDIVRTTCYIRDIERDYRDFNSVRNEFYTSLGLNPFPASTAIQARICRSDLLVEIEAIAMFTRTGAS